MATELLLIREGSHLVPAEPCSAEAIEGMKHGEVVTATIRRVRNPRHHRKFFALMNLVYQVQERFATPEQLLDAIKFEVGLYDLYTLPGKVPVQVVKVRSISFARMDQAEFEKFYDKVVRFIVTDVLPGIEQADLERQVLELVG